MKKTISITSNWQIHIPKEVREKLNLSAPGKVDIVLEKNSFVLKPNRSSILDLAGILKESAKKHPLPLEDVRDYIDYGELT